MQADTTPADGNVSLGDPHQIAYKVSHAAKLVDFSERQMWTFVRNGEIESFKIGSSRRIPRAALLAFIERMQAETVEDTHPPSGPSTPPPPPGPRAQPLRRAG